MKWWQWTIIVALVIGVLVSFIWGCQWRSMVYGSDTVTTVTTDTLIIHDTVRITEPVEVSRTVSKTVYLPASDTVMMHDTLYIRMDRESVTYSDSTYTAYVSGIRPRLDSIFVYPRTAYINTMVETIRTEKAKRWAFGVGVQAGYGITARGFSPYAGMGVTFGYWF